MSFFFKLPYLEYASTIGKVSTLKLHNLLYDKLVQHGSPMVVEDYDAKMEKLELWLDAYTTNNPDKDVFDIFSLLPTKLDNILVTDYSKSMDMTRLRAYTVNKENNTLWFLDEMGNSIAGVGWVSTYVDVKAYKVRSVIIECLVDSMDELANKLEKCVSYLVYSTLWNNFAESIYDLRYNRYDDVLQARMKYFLKTRCLIHSTSPLSDNLGGGYIAPDGNFFHRFGLKYIKESKEIWIGGITDDFNIVNRKKKYMKEHGIFRVIADEPLPIGACILADDCVFDMLDGKHKYCINNYSISNYLENIYFKTEVPQDLHYEEPVKTKKSWLRSIFKRG